MKIFYEKHVDICELMLPTVIYKNMDIIYLFVKNMD